MFEARIQSQSRKGVIYHAAIDGASKRDVERELRHRDFKRQGAWQDGVWAYKNMTATVEEVQ